MTPVRFPCTTAIGAPDDQFTLMVGNTGAIFVEGPRGRTATLSEEESTKLAQIVRARTAR